VVDQVAGGEHAAQVGVRRPAEGEHVALVVEVDLAADELRARVVADGDEQPGDGQRALLAGPGVPGADRLELRVAHRLEDLGVPDELDLRVVEGPLLHDLAGPQGVAAVHEVDLAREAGEEGGLLQRAVAAADDRDVLVAEEEPVAGGAPGDAAAGQLLLTGDAELAVGRAHRQHDGLGVVGVAVDLDDLRVGGEVHLGDVVGDQLGAEALGLLAQVVHQLRAHDAVGEAGEVLDVGRVHQRPAGGDGALEHQRRQVGAREVDGRRVAGRAGAHDDRLADGLRSLRGGGDGGAGAHGVPLVGGAARGNHHGRAPLPGPPRRRRVRGWRR
jgi:hypothetical protein